MNRLMVWSSPNDWLSPMLVKELRQELRTRGFVYGFMIVQGVLLLSLLLNLAAIDDKGAKNFSAGIFWTTICIPLLIVIPRRGSVSANKEARAELLDLVLLTPLSAWKVMFGKWLTCVLLSALFVIAILPYAVLRYFIGSVSLVETGLVLLLLLMGSVIFSAFAIGSSASKKGKGGFGMIIALVGLASFVLPTVTRFLGVSAGFSPSFSPLSQLVLLAVYGALVIVLLLLMAASRISPPGENYAWRQRLIALVSVALIPVMSFTMNESDIAFLFSGILLLITAIGTFMEEPQYVRSIYAPFRRFPGGSILMRLATPGWQSGLLFTLLSAFLMAFLAMFYGGPEGVIFLAGLMLMQILIQPLVVAELFAFRLTIRAYLFIQAGLAFLGTILSILSKVLPPLKLLAVPFFPVSIFFSSRSFSRAYKYFDSLPLILCVICAMLVFLFVRSLYHWDRVRALMERGELIRAIPDSSSVIPEILERNGGKSEEEEE